MQTMGVQIHGGMGFIEETGAAQHLRDSRITPIYEGTTAIQANDLIGRKTRSDGGRGVEELIEDMRETHSAVASVSLPAAKSAQRALGEAIEMISETMQKLTAEEDDAVAAAASVDYLMMMGYALGSWTMARSLIGTTKCDDADFAKVEQSLAHFYFDKLAPHARAHYSAIVQRDGDYYAMDEALLS